MQYSKGEKGDPTESQILRKLQKLKQDISSAEDYHRLEKYAAKIEKIQSNVATIVDRKARKQLRATVEILQGLIKQKIKYFKKKVLYQLNNQSNCEASFSKEQTLKYSKSLENFQMLPTQAQAPTKKNPKNGEEQHWATRTQIQGRKQNHLQGLVDHLREEVETYKSRVILLEKPTNILSYKLGEHQAVFEQEVGLKLKGRGLQIEQLKGRLKYYEETNQQLRNRLANEQKRQDDYVSSLKLHISRLSQELELLGRDHRRLQDELARQSQANGELQNEMRRLVEQSQSMNRERKQRQQSDIKRLNGSEVRKELEVLSQQEKYIREMENMIEGEKEANHLLKEQIGSLNKRENVLLQEITNSQNQKYKLGQFMEISGEEIECLKRELALTIEVNLHKDEDLVVARTALLQCQQQIEKEQMRKDHELRKKAEHLKQVKQLIEGK